MNLLKKEKLILIIGLILFIVPFFWLKPGEMDLGGDSSRLYFYDPVSYLKSVALYSVIPSGVGIVTDNQYILPYTLLLVFLKSIFQSPTILIAIFNGLKLSGSFIFIFLIIRELLNKKDLQGKMLSARFAAIMGALLYTFSPAVLDNMKYALVTHDQVFVYPMVFYFLLLSFARSSLKYTCVAFLISIIFSSSFILSNPPFFAFFPLTIFFLFMYNSFVLRKPIPWKGIIVGILLYVGLHAFHIIPVISSVFDKGSEYNTRVFENSSSVNIGLEYFNAILPHGKVSEHILLPLENLKFNWSLIIIPILVILGFLFHKGRSRTLLLVSIFFFITLFLVSANITQIGVEFYKKLFLIPGFGMFRNFFGQWQWVYTFFYALFAGLAISYLFSKIKKKYIYIIFVLTVGFLVARSWVVFNGNIVDVFNRGSKNLKVIIRMDPHYEQMLAYIKKIANDGKILHMPFTDFAYNLVGGENRGVYAGESMASLLAGRGDFAGYQNMDPYSEVFAKLVKEKNYPLIKQMMSLLRIRYVLYNSDEIISDKFFPTFPYGYTGVPASQPALKEFVNNIVGKKIYEVGYYSLFEVDEDRYLPNFYIASDLFFYDINPKYNTQYFRASSFFPKITLKNQDLRIAFIDRLSCNKIFSKDICKNDNYSLDSKDIQIIFQKINPTKYKVKIKNATEPFLLVFQTAFNQKWKIYQADFSPNLDHAVDSYYSNGIIELKPADIAMDLNAFETNPLKQKKDIVHMEVNSYANGWYIKPSALEQEYEIIVEMEGQKIFYYSAIVSLVSLLTLLLYMLKIVRK